MTEDEKAAAACRHMEYVAYMGPYCFDQSDSDDPEVKEAPPTSSLLRRFSFWLRQEKEATGPLESSHMDGCQ